MKQDYIMRDLMKKPLPVMPADIRAQLDAGNVTPVPFAEKDRLIADDSLIYEVGYKRFPNGNYYCAMYCPMPGITLEMLQWWFWWHAKESARYRVWFPGEHFAISYARKDQDFFRQPKQPPFRANTHFPIEKIGKIALPLKIAFETPEDFGFDPRLMEEHNVPWVVNGHVGAVYGLVSHTEMAHIFKVVDGTPVLISRFWIGETLKLPLIRKAMLNDDTARGMVTHCCIEYRNLAAILPTLYEAYGS